MSGGDGKTSCINYYMKHEVWLPILWGRETPRTPGLSETWDSCGGLRRLQQKVKVNSALD